ncbi:uncharacterized protein BO97DRAFT_433962 [Aspergillus homomorphus CBS 101889]|uniref:SET domain-containing protein n=1 Tax=Aspergillus homomorphus (strain CBS 101889) TaxID=1450537 RepID=A0A395HZA6_ASPHC|nr:hypothetical protein BO97DRAFT_433962 [Aspergillus homomorphus CBS 101889]RAL13262.1 hypothetical protein BO97DRAFT_433962 [Aspergillus homomorphus CBS 101889]
MAPKVAILDDYQNISPRHFEHLTSRVDISYFPDTLNPRLADQQKQLIERLQPFEIIVAQRERTPFSKETLAALPNLKLLLTTGTRNLAIDSQYCAERGIPVGGTQTRPAGINSTVQHTWALILGATRHVARDDAAIKRGEWQGSLGMTLAGKTLGLLGLGKLGAQVGRIAVQGFGLEVIAWSTNLTQAKADEQAEAMGLPAGSFRAVSDKLAFFREADVVSVHSVLSERSRGIVGRPELAAMKKTALLVNTSRGPLVDEAALLETLASGAIAGAALDVFDPEPLPADSPWRTTAWGQDGRSEVLLTPHTGYADEQIHGCPIPFASGAYSLVSLPAGSVFCKIEGTTLSKKAYTSVQTGRDSHIELNSDLVYCNHSCAPTVDFDMDRMEVRVVADRDLKAGDPLTFFYPSSEWEMDQPFQCTCGAGEKCRGVIDGAKNMQVEVLREYWLNPHIEEMVREREGGSL